MRRIKHCAWAEVAAVDVQRLIQHLRCKVACEGEGKAQGRRDLCAVEAAAQDSELHIRASARRGDDAGLAIISKIALQFHHIARKSIWVAVERPPDRGCDALVAPRRTAEPQINSAGIQRIQCSKLFSNDQGGMVGQHDAARTNTHRLGCCRNVPDDNAGRGAGNSAHAVMFGDPVAGEAKAFRMCGQISRVGQCICD